MIVLHQFCFQQYKVFIRGGFDMETYSHKKRSRRASKSMVFIGILILLAMLLAACGSTTSTGGGSTPTANPATPTIAAPSDLITPVIFTGCGDTPDLHP